MILFTTFCALIPAIVTLAKHSRAENNGRLVASQHDRPNQFLAGQIITQIKISFNTVKGEHQKSVVRQEGEKSVLADHVTKTNHDIAWDEATILRTNNNWYQSKILEAWDINCAKDPLNQDNGALLPKEYLHLTLANKKKMTHIFVTKNYCATWKVRVHMLIWSRSFMHI